MTGGEIAFAAIGALWLVVAALIAWTIWREYRSAASPPFGPVVVAMLLGVLCLLWPAVLMAAMVRRDARGGRGA